MRSRRILVTPAAAMRVRGGVRGSQIPLCNPPPQNQQLPVIVEDTRGNPHHGNPPIVRKDNTVTPIFLTDPGRMEKVFFSSTEK